MRRATLTTHSHTHTKGSFPSTRDSFAVGRRASATRNRSRGAFYVRSRDPTFRLSPFPLLLEPPLLMSPLQDPSLATVSFRPSAFPLFAHPAPSIIAVFVQLMDKLYLTFLFAPNNRMWNRKLTLLEIRTNENDEFLWNEPFFQRRWKEREKKKLGFSFYRKITATKLFSSFWNVVAPFPGKMAKVFSRRIYYFRSISFEGGGRERRMESLLAKISRTIPPRWPADDKAGKGWTGFQGWSVTERPTRLTHPSIHTHTHVIITSTVVEGYFSLLLPPLSNISISLSLSLDLFLSPLLIRYCIYRVCVYRARPDRV